MSTECRFVAPNGTSCEVEMGRNPEKSLSLSLHYKNVSYVSNDISFVHSDIIREKW